MAAVAKQGTSRQQVLMLLRPLLAAAAAVPGRGGGWGWGGQARSQVAEKPRATPGWPAKICYGRVGPSPHDVQVVGISSKELNEILWYNCEKTVY